MGYFIFVSIFAWIALPCFAQANLPYDIEYGSTSWNTESTTLDTAYLFIRDPASKQIVKVLVEETAPDSSIFSGKFSINWTTKSESKMQVFVPPQKLRTDAAMRKFTEQIQSGQVSPQPVLLRTTDKSTRVDVYDNGEQLLRAKENLRREREAKAEAERLKNTKPLAQEDTLKAAQITERAQRLAQMATDAAKRESDRLRLEQLEAQRRSERLQQEQKLAAAEKARRKAKAQALADEGLRAYKNADFKSAESFFHQAKEIDPANDSFYFMYGVALYRNEKFNEALVFLRLAKNSTAQDELERQYYMGLIHYRQQENAQALGHFRKVRASGDETLAPSAAFYEGLAQMALDNLSAAEEAFEWVLDHSKDPGMDRKAEAYLEKIAGMIQYREQMKKKWSLTASAGLNYDSNILYTPDNGAASQGSASDKGGARILASGDLRRRLAYSDSSEWSAKLASYYIYSFDSAFNRADPWQTSLGAVYGHRGTTAKNVGYQLSLNPYYEILYLDDDDDGTRNNILGSMVLDGDVTFVKRENYFAAYGFTVRSDDSTPTSAPGTDEDADALQYEINTTHTLMLDRTNKRAVIAAGAFLLNDAKGKNKAYHRLDASVTYAAPMQRWKDTVWTIGLGAYKLRYPDSTDDRQDTNMSLTYTLTKSVSKTWSYTGYASYISNSSSVDEDQYSKYSLMGLVNYSWSR